MFRVLRFFGQYCGSQNIAILTMRLKIALLQNHLRLNASATGRTTSIKNRSIKAALRSGLPNFSIYAAMVFVSPMGMLSCPQNAFFVTHNDLEASASGSVDFFFLSGLNLWDVNLEGIYPTRLLLHGYGEHRPKGGLGFRWP